MGGSAQIAALLDWLAIVISVLRHAFLALLLAAGGWFGGGLVGAIVGTLIGLFIYATSGTDVTYGLFLMGGFVGGVLLAIGLPLVALLRPRRRSN